MATKSLVRILYSSNYTDGYALVWNNVASTWTPQIQDAYRIQNRRVSTTPPTDGYALVWNASTSRWEAGTGSAIRGSSSKVSEIIIGSTTNCPLQTATTGTTSGSSKQISVPDSTGLITLTDGAATFDDTIIGKLVFISASATGGGLSQNLGHFIIVSRPSTTTFTYRNGDGVVDPNGITYSIVSVIPPSGNYGTFLPLATHSITVASIYDTVVVKAQIYFGHSNYNTDGMGVQVDGNPVGFYDTGAASGAVYKTISYAISGLTVGAHVVQTGCYSDYGHFAFYTGAHIGDANFSHFDIKTRSIVTVIPGISF